MAVSVSGIMLLALGCGDDGSSGSPADAAAPDAAVDAAVDASPADAPIDAPPADVVIENASLTGCANLYSIGPVLPDEASHLAASRLTPATYPFRVTKVGYDLTVASSSSDCIETLAHKVELYVTTAAKPTNMPSADATLVATIDVPAPSAGTGQYISLEHTLASPINLTTGQHLVVAVEMAANQDESKSLCIEACNSGGTSGVNFWSNAAAEPYAWADMIDDFGFTADYTIRATGTPQ